jgi:hypothetical protein
MPPEIRHILAPFFPAAVLQRVRHSFTWETATQGGLLNVLLGTGAVAAVTLGDVIVFRDEQSVGDPLLWAHELVHVEQYRRLGIEGFATQYLQQSWILEQEAIAKAEAVKGQLSH